MEGGTASSCPPRQRQGRGMPIDLNSDLGEGMGSWSMGDDGAHVAYRDHAGFGRRFIDMEPTVLTDEVIYQIGALDGMARRHGHRVTYVKPHGGLYNAIVTHEEQARAVVAAVHEFDAHLVLMG